MTKDKNESTVKRKRHYLKYALLILFVIAVVTLCIVLFPWLKSLKFEVTEEWLIEAKEWVDRFGVFKYAVILLLQLLQVLVAIIPGEPVEIFSGYMCGTFGGLAVCELGAFIGSYIIYKAVEKYGRKLVYKVADSKAYEKLGFLHNSASRDGFLFLLFFLPGTPKDVLIYFAPLLKVGVRRFLLISAVARIPSIVSSTYVGETLSEGNIAFSVIIFALTAAVGALGILINDLILEKQKRKKNLSENAENTKNH